MATKGKMRNLVKANKDLRALIGKYKISKTKKLQALKIVSTHIRRIDKALKNKNYRPLTVKRMKIIKKLYKRFGNTVSSKF